MLSKKQKKEASKLTIFHCKNFESSPRMLFSLISTGNETICNISFYFCNILAETFCIDRKVHLASKKMLHFHCIAPLRTLSHLNMIEVIGLDPSS